MTARVPCRRETDHLRSRIGWSTRKERKWFSGDAGSRGDHDAPGRIPKHPDVRSFCSSDEPSVLARLDANSTHGVYGRNCIRLSRREKYLHNRTPPTHDRFAGGISRRANQPKLGVIDGGNRDADRLDRSLSEKSSHRQREKGDDTTEHGFPL